MKTILPWILVLAFGAAAATFYVSGNSKNAELEKLRSENQEAQQLRTELDELKTQAKVQNDKIEEMRKDHDELLKLRGVNQQLSKQAQTAQSDAQRAQAEILRAQAQAAQATQASEQKVQQIQNANQALLSAVVQTRQNDNRNACINNLRQLDGAKQQWALEKGKTADALPVAEDITPYLKDNALPNCPGGGTYTLNAVNQLPTCTVAGHTLSNQ